MFKKWWHWVLLFVGIILILTCCAGVASAAYWLGTTQMVAEKPPVAQVTEEPGAQETEQPVLDTPTQPAAVANTPVVQAPSGSSDVQEIFRSGDALAYPVLIPPDASRQPVFPDVPYGNRPALARYETPFEDGDYFETGKGDVDLPQYYFRVMTAGTVEISQLGVNCVATPTKGCAVILVNHFGETAMFRNAEVDNGFTIAGLVFDMSTPEKTVLAAQALIDHYVLRMTVNPNDGANCSVITGCESVEWHVLIIGNGEVQTHWTGLFRR